MRLNIGQRLRNIVLAGALGACSAAATDDVRWNDRALDDLVAMAEQAPREGLPSEGAAISEIEEMRASGDISAPAQVDLLADALFERLATTFARGGANPESADPTWYISGDPAPDLTALRMALARGASPSALLRPLLPTAPDYLALRAELERLRAEPADAVDAHGHTRTARLASVRASMERWRWLPRTLPSPRVEAHIPQFEIVRFGQNDTTVHSAIVGAGHTQTPSFATTIVGVTLNPYWTPPSSILLQELAPAFRRNAAAASGYEVTDRQGRVLDPATVNWGARPLNVQVRQRPGPANALGQLKFEMPNPYNIYMHDTPSRQLFDRSMRAFSHGCIRVHEPIDLAVDLLGGSTTRQDLEDAIGLGTTETRPLPQPIAFMAVYMTATVAADGTVSYVNDIYGRDDGIIRALDAPDVALVAQTGATFSQCATA